MGIVGWIVCLLLSVTAAPESPPAGTPPAAAGATPPAASTISAEEASALARDIMPRVEQIRGRRFLRPVPVRVVDDQEARRHFESRLRKFHPEDRMRAEQEALADLGLLPPGTDLTTSLFSLLEEQAGGYYAPDSDTFFVLSDMPRAAGPVLVAHELTHALDDQHFSIDTFYDKARSDDDRATVAGAVVEGSGSAVMTAFLIQEMQAGRLDPSALKEIMQSEAGRAEKLTASPPILQRSLMAPYMLGQTLALRGDPMAIAKGVRAEDIDRLFQAPPLSTEQLLHPEKYWDPARSDPPREVSPGDLSAVLGEGWTLGADGVMGEITLALLCGAANPSFTSPDVTHPSAWTNDCAAGWGGDRWQIYRAGGRRVTLAATVWDTETDAAEFEAHAARKELRPARRGAAVVLVSGDPGDLAARLAAEALSRISAPPPAP